MKPYFARGVHKNGSNAGSMLGWPFAGDSADESRFAPSGCRIRNKKITRRLQKKKARQALKRETVEETP